VLLDLAAAVPLLEMAASGAAEVLGALADDPVLVIDLDSDGDAVGLQVPLMLPAVVVGMSQDARPTGRDGPDVLVCGRPDLAAPDPAAPWVVADDVEEELAALQESIRVRPIASVTFAHVLRSAPESIPAGLILESLAYSTLQEGPEFRAWLAERTPRAAEPAGAGPAVLSERDGGRLALTFNRPSVHNAYNAASRDALCAALAVAAGDDSIEEIHLYGAGPSFCSGGDLSEFGSRRDPATAHLIRTGRSGARLLAEMSGRVTAHLHGACIGAGIELPAFVGRVEADADTRIQLPEIALGLIPGAGGTVSLPRRIGRHRTAWLGLTGRRIDATTALAWGLVDEVHPPGD
jgi:enoyl-CoA hydratase/carnithine racemase